MHAFAKLLPAEVSAGEGCTMECLDITVVGHPVALLVLANGSAVGGYKIVKGLIATQLNGEFCSIALAYDLSHSLGGNGRSDECEAANNQKS